MKVLFSTDTVHVRDRLDYWREEASKAYVAHQFSTSVGRSFHGLIRAASLGDLDLALFECDDCIVRHTERCLKRAADDDLLVALQVAGRMAVHQDGRDALTNTNDMHLIDPRRPFSLGVRSGSHSLVVKVPRWEMQARLGDLAGLTARPIPSHRPVAALASGFLAMLAARADAIDGPAGARLVQQALDLVALAFETESKSGPAALSSSRTTTLLRLKAIIEARLYDPALKPALAAAATGISVRYANALLAEEATSLERFIVERRLHHCRQALEDPAQASRTVTAIAYTCGFSDASHFTRRFKALFGRSPSECRPRAK